MHHLIRPFVAFGSVVVLCANSQAPDAAGVLAAARKALGSDERLSTVRTLSLAGDQTYILTSTATGAQRTITAQFELLFDLPDKFVTRVAPAPGRFHTNGFNGASYVYSVDSAGPPGTVNSSVDRARTPEERRAMIDAMVVELKQEFARLALGLFVRSFDTFPLKFSYGGIAESPDSKADIVDAKGEAGFAARLFIDSRTHLPLMASWHDKEPRRTIYTNDRVDPESPNMRVAENEAARKMVEYRMYYSDYRDVDGMKIPFKIATGMAGQPPREMAVKKARINVNLDASLFKPFK